MNYEAPNTIMQAIQDRLGTLLTWDSSEPLFDHIGWYDREDAVAEALRQMIRQTTKRVCIIRPSSTVYENRNDGNSVHSRRWLDLDLYVCDRVFASVGSSQPAKFGGPGNEGALPMSEIVVNALAGDQLGNSLLMLPENGGFVEVQDAGKKVSSTRSCWLQPFLVDAGETTFKRPLW